MVGNNPSVVVPGTQAAPKINISKALRDQKVASYFCALIQFSVLVDKKTEAPVELCFRTLGSIDKRSVLRWKFPGGDFNNDFSTPPETLQREVNEEVLRQSTKVELDESKTELVYQRDKSDQVHQGWFHRQYFFLGLEKDMIGYTDDRCYRSRPVLDGEDILLPTVLMPVSVLARGLIHTTHLSALIAAIRFLMENEPAIIEFIPRDVCSWATNTDIENPTYLR